jgi:hypothetical protein
MFGLGLMAALFISQLATFLAFSKTSEIVIDVNAGVEKVILWLKY